MPTPSRQNTSSDLMTEPTVTFPVVPVDMKIICRHLNIDSTMLMRDVAIPPMEGELMFAIPHVTRKCNQMGRSKLFAPTLSAVVTLSQLNCLLAAQPKLSDWLEDEGGTRQTAAYAFACPFVGVFKTCDIIGKGRQHWNIVASRRAPTLCCFAPPQTPACTGDSLVLQWSIQENITMQHTARVKVIVVGVGELTEKLQSSAPDGVGCTLVPIGVLKHSPSKVASSQAVAAYEDAIFNFPTDDQAKWPHIGNFRFGLVDVELGCHM
jgi:hypothetical protein